MLTTRNCLQTMFMILPMLSLSGCPTKQTEPADAGPQDAPAAVSDASIANKQGLASACTSNGDCTSGFCSDGVCCDSACDQQCYSCATTTAVGHCGPLFQGPDPVATTPCTDGNTCVLNPSTSAPACKLQNLEKCVGDSDCASGHCLTFFVDSDGDGYGTAASASFCTTLAAAPPSGYATLSGDCCDIDSGANPGVSASTYFQFADACGSFDWNCDGMVEEEKACPTAVTCGAGCVQKVLFLTETLFTESCH